MSDSRRFASSVESLLTTQCFDDDGQHVQPQSFNLTHFPFSSLVSSNPPTTSSSHFSSHVKLLLPDLPPFPNAPPVTSVYVFDLKPSLHASVVAPLLTSCLSLESTTDPTVVSNVGGFHSSVNQLCVYHAEADLRRRQLREKSPKEEEFFEPLHAVLTEALDIVLSSSNEACVGIETPPPYPPPSSGCPPDASFSNCLLLRSQLRRFSHEYGFTSITPKVGRVVVFPGYVPHCVCPRSPSPFPSLLPCPPRVSIACNVSKPAATGGGREVTGWANVSRDLAAFNTLHDHGDEDFAFVIYLADGEGESEEGNAGLGRGGDEA